MKAIRIIGHPVLLISTFLLLIIEGENFGGFYLLYLLMAIPHGAAYALLALTGIICVFCGYKINFSRSSLIKGLLYSIGFSLMLLSLFVFFGRGNKWDTFQLFIPLLSFILFGVSSVCFLLNVINIFAKGSKPIGNNLNAAL